MRPINGYEGLYSVTRNGAVWSHANRLHEGKWLKQSLRSGYPSVDLCNGSTHTSFSVHRLVADAYIPNPRRLPQINHKNSNKEDNRAINLEWCTASYNTKHSWDNGTSFVTDAKREASRRNCYKMLAKRGFVSMDLEQK